MRRGIDEKRNGWERELKRTIWEKEEWIGRALARGRERNWKGNGWVLEELIGRRMYEKKKNG